MFASRGGHWPRKGVWGCAALKTPFSHLSCRSQGSHVEQKSQFTRFSFEKIYSLNFHPNFSSQATKFGNFQLTSPQIWKFSAHKPQIWKFSAHKPPFSEANVSSQAPHFENPGRTPLPEKKLSAPLGFAYLEFSVAITATFISRMTQFMGIIDLWQWRQNWVIGI